MSRRNRPAAKAVRRNLKLLRAPLPAYVDLVEWIRMRYPMSRGRARAVLLAGALQVDSHVVGRAEVTRPDGTKQTVVDRHIASSLCDHITVVEPEHLKAG